MPHSHPSDDELRSQIDSSRSHLFSTQSIEARIAVELLSSGYFEGQINNEELGVILRNVVYTMFAEHKVAGHTVGLVHNVPTMNVNINGGEAEVDFLVHIHKPIVAFIQFRYTLVNDPVSIKRRIRLKKGTLQIVEHKRRMDLKARAALAAINVEHIARKELADIAGIIVSTLPLQLSRLGYQGIIRNVELDLEDCHMNIYLEGEFTPVSAD